MLPNEFRDRRDDAIGNGQVRTQLSYQFCGPVQRSDLTQYMVYPIEDYQFDVALHAKRRRSSTASRSTGPIANQVVV